MKKKTINNITNRIIGTWIYYGLLALYFTACSSEEVQTDNSIVHIVSVSKTKGSSDTELTPSDGTYYLGYRTQVGEAVSNPIQSIELTGGIIAETGLYWANINKESDGKAFFTLSNVSEEEYPEKNDILWADCSIWMQSLTFQLKHLMAGVKVELELGDDLSGTNIEKVELSAIRQEFTFDRNTGIVTPEGNSSVLTLENSEQDTDTDWSVLLPPQERTDDMELAVTTNGKVFKRKLPYSMIEGLGNGQSQSIPLAFRAGHRLVLTAKVTDNTDYTIFFTGATLKDWEYVGSYGVVVKPAGIYTETELKDWTVKYNRYKQDKSETNRKALLRYGTLQDEKWTFKISRNIEVMNSMNLEKINDFTDKLTRLNNYKIKGITQDDLMQTGTGADISNDLFE